MGDGIVHGYLNTLAIERLKDSNPKAASFFDDYKEFIDDGAIWADRWLMPVFHFYHPISERGFLNLPGAKSLAEHYQRRALSRLRRGQIEDAMFFLGGALHVVQDATIPHHVQPTLVGHRPYEQYVRGLYKAGEIVKPMPQPIVPLPLGEAVAACAMRTIKVAVHCNECNKFKQMRYECMAKRLLPLAIQVSACCFEWFYINCASQIDEVTSSVKGVEGGIPSILTVES